MLFVNQCVDASYWIARCSVLESRIIVKRTLDNPTFVIAVLRGPRSRVFC